MVTSGELVVVVVAGCTVRASVAVWVRLPEVPVKVIVCVEAGEVLAAVSVVLCAVPGVRVRVAGDTVMVGGNPEIAILTLPLKEFNGVARIWTAEPV